MERKQAGKTGITGGTKKPIRVSQLNAYIARLIAADGVLSDVTVTGEVSNYKLHGSGHVYFSLKDEASRIDCFLPSGIFRGLGFKLTEGAEVVAEGYVNVYEKGGRYTLSVRKLAEAGRGDLALAFEELKKKLAEKGYFDEGRKKPLPRFPLTIAIVTSETGAAISDMQKIITSRNSVVDILIFPTLVQGPDAARMIASRIRRVNADFPGTDVMIVGRGGGSSEDLAAWSEEAVADAIFESRIPVISAVGHETDFTIADFVADRRAETPSAAAALAAPDTAELAEDLGAFLWQIKSRVDGVVSRIGLRIRANNMEALFGRLKSGIAEREARADSLIGRIRASAREGADRMADLRELRAALRDAMAKKAGREAVAELAAFRAALGSAVTIKAERAWHRARAQAEKLGALNPLGVLSRGYAIVEDEGGRAVSRAGALSPGQCIRARFSDGRADATVKNVEL